MAATEEKANCKIKITGGINFERDVTLSIAHRIIGLSIGEATPPVTPPSGTLSARQKPGPGGVTVRDFIKQKRPGNDSERVACLAYFLTESESLAVFTTTDINRVAVAAGRPFAKGGTAVNDALTKYGYLASAGKKGSKQLSPRGEGVVEALPDSEAVKLFLAENPMRKRKTTKAKKK